MTGRFANRLEQVPCYSTPTCFKQSEKAPFPLSIRAYWTNIDTVARHARHHLGKENATACRFSLQALVIDSPAVEILTSASTV